VYGKCSTEYTKGTQEGLNSAQIHGSSVRLSLPQHHKRTSIARGQVTFISEIARLTTVLHSPFIEANNVKWRFAGQRAAAVLNCPAQADTVRASTLRRVVR
jgi:hypothetical protein